MVPVLLLPSFAFNSRVFAAEKEVSFYPRISAGIRVQIASGLRIYDFLCTLLAGSWPATRGFSSASAPVGFSLPVALPVGLTVTLFFCDDRASFDLLQSPTHDALPGLQALGRSPQAGQSWDPAHRAGPRLIIPAPTTATWKLPWKFVHGPRGTTSAPLIVFNDRAEPWQYCPGLSILPGFGTGKRFLIVPVVGSTGRSGTKAILCEDTGFRPPGSYQFPARALSSFFRSMEMLHGKEIFLLGCIGHSRPSMD